MQLFLRHENVVGSKYFVAFLAWVLNTPGMKRRIQCMFVEFGTYRSQHRKFYLSAAEKCANGRCLSVHLFIRIFYLRDVPHQFGWSLRSWHKIWLQPWFQKYASYLLMSSFRNYSDLYRSLGAREGQFFFKRANSVHEIQKFFALILDMASELSFWFIRRPRKLDLKSSLAA